ncbi:MAG: SUKH-3 domain-containing protein [Planctomycetota bacterium]
MELHADLLSLFATAGWHSDWKFVVPTDNSHDHPAFNVLSRFGGLHLKPYADSGVECATADVDIRPLEHRSPTVDRWESHLATTLVGFALASDTYAQLWIAADSRVFASNDVNDCLGYVGDGFNSAIRNVLTGVRHQPLLAPGETGVNYYGEDYHAGDPRVYNWQSSVG